jgi:predicted DNA-binding antitoxin AbrB/MazE fold protein
MKILPLALVVFSTLSLSQHSRAQGELTDEMAMEEGMTPAAEYLSEQAFMDTEFQLNRSEYVTTIPSLADIQQVIGSHRQVIVVNKAASGADAQTLRVYQNGVIKPLLEQTTITQIVNGKKVKKTITELKDFVKISSGREKNEVAKSGRSYFSTTPRGFFRPQRVYTMYYSNTWKADMPNAVFINCSRNDFNKECGIALHATTESHFAALGKRDSGGCVRTRPEVSTQLRELVMDTGLGRDKGSYSLVTESYRRWKVLNNKVSVDLVNRDSGAIVNKKVSSWDTVIVIYE